MNRISTLCFCVIAMFLMFVPSYAHAIDSSIAGEQTYFCNSMPCHYTTPNGMYVEIYWTVSQNAYVAVLDSTVFIDGVLFGKLRMDAVALQDGTFDVTGEVIRDAGNSVNLPPFQIPFHINAQSPQPGTIPYLSPDDIGFLSIALTTQDVKFSKLNNNNPNPSNPDTLVCGKNHTKNDNMGCDGPFRGFLIFFPIFNGDGVADCCDAHDICFLVGGPAKGQDECNKILFKCIEPHIPWYSSPWTDIATADIWWGDNDGYLEHDANCRCTFDTDKYDLSMWRDQDYNQVYVGHAECCEGSDKCGQNSCEWKFLKDGKEKWKFDGKCISLKCNNDGVVDKDQGEECDVGNGGKDTCGDGFECISCECIPLCGNGRLDVGEECEPPNNIVLHPNGSGYVCNDDCTKSLILGTEQPVPGTPLPDCKTATDSSSCSKYGCADPEEECMSNYGGSPACECRKKAKPAPTPNK